MNKISTENNFSYLFFSLVTLLFSTALLKEADSEWASILLDIIIFFVFILSTFSVKSNRKWMWAIFILSFLHLSLLFTHRFISLPVTEFLHLVILLFFFAGTFYTSFWQIITRKKIDKNMIIGSAVLYLLIGLVWTVIYLLLLMIYPDAFLGLEQIAWQENYPRVAYYSFVTLTTLGYGDIAPNNSIAQFFVYSEAISGVFFMALIVSSLVTARLVYRVDSR